MKASGLLPRTKDDDIQGALRREESERKEKAQKHPGYATNDFIRDILSVTFARTLRFDASVGG